MDFDRLRPAFDIVASKLWDARAGDQTLTPLSTSVELLPGDNVSFTVRFPRPDRGPVVLHAREFESLPPGHRQFVIVTTEQGAALAKKLLSAADNTIEIPMPALAATVDQTPPTFFGFLRLGIEHIWTGYDHLLFLFALLVVCRTFRSIVTVISCFTLAHSLTLALATLNLITIPSRITEPAIAASIVFVGIENLLRRGAEPKGRWAVTFAFGLIHGFGFASVLRDLGVGGHGQSIALPLFTFNLGVEIGQIVVAALVLPLIWRLRRNERFVRVGVPALSAVVALAGIYWFLERTVFS
jgi:hydrogenase/urease accessory protein HupE